MACRYTYEGKTYEVSEFDDLLRAMSPVEASRFMPSVRSMPLAPFVNKTEGWLALALKRVIGMAVDQGYDRVAFVTGEQSAERYNLSKQIDGVQWRANYQGGGRLISLVDKRSEVIGVNVDPDGVVYDSSIDGAEGKRLDEVLGKELADRIMTQPTGDMSGAGLSFGGEGMKAFYDKIVPSTLKPLLKRLGGDQLMTVELPDSMNGRDLVAAELGDGAAWGVYDRNRGAWLVDQNGREAFVDDPEYADSYSERAAKQAASAMMRDAGTMLNQPGFDISDAMREKLAGGIPLFSAREAPATNAFQRWFQGSKMVDASGNPQVYYHGSGQDLSVIQSGAASGNGSRNFGIYFTEDPAYAARYAANSSGNLSLSGDGGAVYPVYLSIKNPLVIELTRNADPKSLVDKIRAKLSRPRIEKTPTDVLASSMYLSESDIAKLRDEGYDGIINRAWNEVVAFDPGQVKSATGNDGGFDPSNPDIRFSAREDARGKQTDSEAFKKWFGGSKVVGDQGQPLTVYHSTFSDFDEFSKTADIGFHFGSSRVANDRIEGAAKGRGRGDERLEGVRLMPVWLSIQNPLRLPKDPITWVPDYLIKLIGDAIPQVDRDELLQLNLDAVARARARAADLKAAGGEGTRRERQPDGSMKAAMTDKAWISLLKEEQAIVYTGIKGALERAGYDGVTYINEVEGEGRGSTGRAKNPSNLTWVAFRPDQIKSAIGNGGDFDGGNPGIRFSARSAWDMPEPTRFDDFVYKSQDKLIDLKRVIQSITKSVGAVAEDINAYLQEELFHGRSAKRAADFGSDELKPLMEKMAAQGLGIEDVEEYLHARHAREANQVIADRNPGVLELQDGGSGMSNADADAYMAALTPERKRKLEDAAADVDAIIDRTRQLYVDYGLETQDTVDSWKSLFKHYIPLQREEKDGGSSTPMGIGQGFSIKGKETKGRTGSKRKVVDILGNIAQQRERLIVRGEKNRVAMALVGLVGNNPNPDFWTFGPPPAERVYDPKTNTVVERVDPMYRMRPNVLVAKMPYPGGEIREIGVVFNEDNARAVRLAAALKNLDAGNLEGVLGVSAKVTRYFSSINTQYNPVFGVVNLIRDVQGALINLGGTPLADSRARIARDTMSALAGIYGDVRATRKGGQATSAWAALWDEFQNEGGQTGYRELFRTGKDRADALQKILTPDAWADTPAGKVFTAGGALKVPMSQAKKGAEWIFNWLSDYNEALENGVRLAAYKAALSKGMSKKEAASLAKNLTVNFNRRGQLGMQAGAVYAFFNAAMQGTARLGQLIFDMDDGKINTLRLSKTGKKVVYGGVVLGSFQALALAAAGFDDEDPPEFQRERSLIIPTGGKTYLAIPMPLGLHVIPGVGRHLTEFALSGFEKPAQRAISMLGMFADSFNPIGNAGMSMQTIAPTILDPFVALTENKDFTGRAIARTSMNPATPGHALYKDTASTVSKVLSEAINLATGGNEYVAGALSPTPDQIDYLIGQVTGGVGREISKLEQAGLATLRGEDLPTYKIPLLGRFIGNAASQASEGTAFYANVQKLNELETEVKGLRGDGRVAEAQAMLSARPDAYLIGVANATERQVQRLRREKRDLIERGASRADIRGVEVRITEAMARLNRAAERLEGAQQRVAE